MARATRRGCEPVQRAQELGVVVCIGGSLARVTPRSNARCAMERLDLEARVVRQRGHAREPRVGSGLQAGVRLEGTAGLGDLLLDSEVVQRDELDRNVLEQLTQFAQLVR